MDEALNILFNLIKMLNL